MLHFTLKFPLPVSLEFKWFMIKHSCLAAGYRVHGRGGTKRIVQVGGSELQRVHFGITGIFPAFCILITTHKTIKLSNRKCHLDNNKLDSYFPVPMCN